MQENPTAETFTPAITDSSKKWAQPDYSHMALAPSPLEFHSHDCMHFGRSEYDADESLRLTIRGLKGLGWTGIFGTASGLLGEATNPANEGRVGVSGVVALGVSTLFTVGVHMFERHKKQRPLIRVKDGLR